MDFAPTKAEANKNGREVVVAAIDQQSIARLDAAQYLASVAGSRQDMVHNGTDYLKVLTEYAQQPFYRQFFEETVEGVLSLLEQPFFEEPQRKTLVESLLLDPTLPVILKAKLEVAAYKKGLAKDSASD